MKSKQLANVLIKILGLSMIVHVIPNLLNTLIGAARASSSGYFFNSSASYFSLVLFLFVPTIGLGIALILGSRQVTDFLFKDETE